MNNRATENFGKMVKNQIELWDTLSNNTKEVLGILKPNENVMEDGQALFQEYIDKSKTIAEEAVQTEIGTETFENLSDYYKKTYELQMEFFNKTANYYKDTFENFTSEQQQEKLEKIVALYQNNWKAVLDATNANTKLLSRFF